MNKKGFLTVGYGSRKLQDFITTLLNHRVDMIVDVRSSPKSSFKDYDSYELEKTLAQNGIKYKWMGGSLGGRYDEECLCMEDGTVDYTAVSKTSKFKKGIKELEALIKTNNVCIMCSEQDPLRCHRFMLVSRQLRVYNIYHILDLNKYISHARLEEKILSDFSEANRQLSLFDKLEDTIENAYMYLNQKHAYKSKKALEAKRKNAGKLRLYTIGFTQKNAEEFFELLTSNNVKKIIDIRLNNNSQLAGFSKEKDLKYFLELHGIKYEYMPYLAPSEELKKQFVCKKPTITFDEYTVIYKQLLKDRSAIESLAKEDLDCACFLCSEDKPDECHRRLLVLELSEYLGKDKVVIIHLI